MKRDRTIQNMILGILFMSGMIWFNTLVHQIGFSGSWDSFLFLKTALLTSFYTWICYSWFIYDPSDVPLRNSAKMCAVGTAVSGVLMLTAMLLESGTDSFSLYGEKEIVLWWISIPKKYVYDVWTILWYPYHLSVIFQAMRKERFQLESLFYGCIAVFGLTLEGIFIFQSMSNIWLVDLMVLNTATLALAVWKYVFSEKYIKKGNAIAAVILYAVVRIALLPLHCNNWGEKFTTFMYGDGWSELVSGINEVVSNASLLGTSDYLLHSEFVHSWLYNRNAPLLHLLFLGGWVPVIILLLLFVCFLVLLGKLLGVKNGRKHRNWLIFATAAVMLSVRTVFGVLYSFCIMPYPINLPFLGSNGSFMDVMAFTLSLFGAWENRKIQKYYQMDTTFVPAEELLGSQDTYIILDEYGYPYEEEFYDDEVDIIREDGKIHCNAEWYDSHDRVLCVFTTRFAEMDLKRFILEYTYDGKWALPEDSEGIIQKEICQQYIRANRPDSMEGEVKYREDEEDDY